MSVGRLLMGLGAVIFVVGALLVFADRVPFIGKLPGDILIKKDNFTLFLPLTSSILLSLALSMVWWLIRHFRP